MLEANVSPWLHVYNTVRERKRERDTETERERERERGRDNARREDIVR